MPYTEEYIKHLEVQRRIFMVINIIAALSIGLLFYFWNQQRDAIQEQRYEFVLRSCEDQNSRRANTIATLNNEIIRLPTRQRARAQKNEIYTIALINALAPHQNCIVAAEQATHPPKTGPN